MTTATATANAPKQRKTKKQPRSISLIVPLSAEGKNGIIRIASGKQVDEYFLDQLFTDYGDGFELTKRTYDGEDNRYHVNLDGQLSTCDCKGHLQHRHCKHVEGMLALKAAGKL